MSNSGIAETRSFTTAASDAMAAAPVTSALVPPAVTSAGAAASGATAAVAVIPPTPVDDGGPKRVCEAGTAAAACISGTPADENGGCATVTVTGPQKQAFEAALKAAGVDDLFVNCRACRDIVATGGVTRKDRFHRVASRLGWGAGPCRFQCDECRQTACRGHFQPPERGMPHRDYLLLSPAQQAAHDEKIAAWAHRMDAAQHADIPHPRGFCACCWAQPV